ncbi:MAG: thiosulfate oxidation carrier complex protein SoxZ, partial [Pseudomonadota bacterium]|nr:thiosulfate oxidation carrier complex protein SoxZ [Pseudomonadota bacterium]
MADPMRIRATEQPDGVDVRVLMAHEMETGQRRDSAGKIVPAHFISNVTV